MSMVICGGGGGGDGNGDKTNTPCAQRGAGDRKRKLLYADC